MFFSVFPFSSSTRAGIPIAHSCRVTSTAIRLHKHMRKPAPYWYSILTEERKQNDSFKNHKGSRHHTGKGCVYNIDPQYLTECFLFASVNLSCHYFVACLPPLAFDKRYQVDDAHPYWHMAFRFFHFFWRKVHGVWSCKSGNDKSIHKSKGIDWIIVYEKVRLLARTISPPRIFLVGAFFVCTVFIFNYVYFSFCFLLVIATGGDWLWPFHSRRKKGRRFFGSFWVIQACNNTLQEFN